MMTKIGFSLSAEEFGPRELVRLGVTAEDAGFPYALVSDHFHPWIDAQGHSPFVWVVLGGLAQATKTLRFGTGVTCPTIRIHPALIAQAAATTASASQGRFFLGVGTGESLNERILGAPWPPYSVRLEMLKEAIGLIRELWQGRKVTRRGNHFTAQNARIYTLPDQPPPLYMAAAGKESAAVAAEFADGIIMTTPAKDLIQTFTDSGGTSKPRYGQMTVCWASSIKKAKETALRYWPIAAMPGSILSELPQPAQFEATATLVREDDIEKAVVCGPDPEAHLSEIRRYISAGFDHVYVHQIGQDQEGCIRFYEQEILPAIQRVAA